MTYIQNNEFYTLSDALGKGYDLSKTNSREDFKAGKIILLNEAQSAFKELHPFATTLEVFNLALTPIPQISLEQIKARKIAAIEAYDTSSAVNSFSINGVSMWIDRATRVSLRFTIAAYKAMGINEITLWTTGSIPASITLTVVPLENLLTELEIYAKLCYDNTARHKAEVQEYTTDIEVEEYDITAGYPTKLSRTI